MKVERDPADDEDGAGAEDDEQYLGTDDPRTGRLREEGEHQSRKRHVVREGSFPFEGPLPREGLRHAPEAVLVGKDERIARDE